MTPTKPSGVQLEQMKAQLQALQQLHAEMTGPGSTHIQKLMNADDIGLDLSPACGIGTQGDVASNMSQRYETVLSWINHAHNDLTQGVGTMITLLTHTINGHNSADSNTSQGANSTGTGASTPGSSGPNTGVPNSNTAAVS